MKNLRKTVSLLLILSMCLAMVSCGPKKEEDKRQRFSCDIWDSFDTVITVMAFCQDEEEFGQIETLSKELFREYHQIFDIYNDYEGVVNVKTLNDNAGTAPVKVPQEIIDLIKLGKRLYEETDGNVNIAFGSVLKIWHEARDTAENEPGKAYVPDIELLRSAAQHCNIDDVIIDEQESTVYLADPLMSLDVGAIAKGLAAEMVAEKLQEKGFDCFLITAGTSSIKAVGKKPDGSSWTSAVETDPEYNLIQISDHSITTSGIYQRYYLVDGVMYHHIINKDTLMPEENFLSVTLITDDCGAGDGLATAIFNMSLEDGMAFVDSHSGIYAMWVGIDKTKTYSKGFEDFIRKQ